MASNPDTETVNADPAEVNMAQENADGPLTHRQCLMYITNWCSKNNLCNARWYTYSGTCASPLPPTIRPNDTGNALFVKTPKKACGSVGVITYDLLDDANQPCEKVAIMFSNPFDFISFSNLFAVGVIDKGKECDEHLYNEMYYGSSKDFKRDKSNGCVLTHKGERVTIQATMSDAYQSVIKVQVYDTKTLSLSTSE